MSLKLKLEFAVLLFVQLLALAMAAIAGVLALV